MKELKVLEISLNINVRLEAIACSFILLAAVGRTLFLLLNIPGWLVYFVLYVRILLLDSNCN